MTTTKLGIVLTTAQPTDKISPWNNKPELEQPYEVLTRIFKAHGIFTPKEDYYRQVLDNGVAFKPVDGGFHNMSAVQFSVSYGNHFTFRRITIKNDTLDMDKVVAVSEELAAKAKESADYRTAKYAKEKEREHALERMKADIMVAYPDNLRFYYSYVSDTELYQLTLERLTEAQVRQVYEVVHSFEQRAS